MLISIDTCRADHLSAYGYERETSPTLRRLASAGVRFDQAFAHAPDTTPSHASILTSQHPFIHGAANGVPLGPGFVTLAEVLKGQGFATGAFVSGWTMTARGSGLQQGFDVYDDQLTHAGSALSARHNERPAAATTDRALQWLSDNADQSLFLFVHYFDPHAVYQPPPPYDRMFEPSGDGREIPTQRIPAYARIPGLTDLERYVALYDGEIRYVDDQIARVVARLEQLDILDETLIVVTADHGEGLGEHDAYFSHGFDLYDPSIRVPLIFHYPDRLPTGQVVGGIARSLDIMPSILELLDFDGGLGLAGSSLVHAMTREAPTGIEHTIARTTKTLTYPELGVERDIDDLVSYRTDSWKLIQTQDGSLQLFDLITDEEEQRDLAGERSERRDRLRDELDRALEPMGVGGTVEDDRLAQLRSLGYVR